MADETQTCPRRLSDASRFAGPPEAVVERPGRWRYRVYVRDGWVLWGPNGYGWAVFGRQRAARKAGRVIAGYVRDRERRADVFVVRRLGDTSA